MLNETDMASSEIGRLPWITGSHTFLSRMWMGPVRQYEPGYSGFLSALLLGCCPFAFRSTSASFSSSACMLPLLSRSRSPCHNTPSLCDMPALPACLPAGRPPTLS